jgi:hypothetical protein
MNRRAVYEKELAATLRGELRRAAARAGDAFEALQGLSALGLASTDELFPGATSRELRTFARQLRALAAESGRSVAEIECMAGRVEALASIRDAAGS